MKYSYFSFKDRVVKEIEIKDGIAGSSGYSSDGKPVYAFNNVTGYWLSEEGINFPKMIWYQFPKFFIPAELTFVSEVRRFQFVGTNDDVCNEKSSWTMLSQDFDSEAKEFGFLVKVLQVPALYGKSYQCLGLRLFDKGRDMDGIVSVGNVRMWQQV